MQNDLIERISGTVEKWLRPDSMKLKKAIAETVDKRYFSLPDIQHQIIALKKVLSRQSLSDWAKKNGLLPGELENRKALCLHAGNIPLVGIQDLLACLVTGAEYTGKISRKDPYLLPSLLEMLVTDAGVDATWSEDIGNLAGAHADCVLFSGSGKSVDKVKERIARLHLAKKKADYLIRTAGYSLAFIDSDDPETMQDLTEAVFRYSGRGCRSVAVVISPYGLEEIRCHLTDYIESFWIHNPQHVKPAPSLFYRYAYNKAAGYTQAWLDDFLIEETSMAPDHEFTLHWVRGGMNAVPEFLRHYGAGLQTVYSNRKIEDITGTGVEAESLKTAQEPPIDWRPDGVDSIQWLLSRFRAH